MTNLPHPDEITDCVLKTFNTLPAKFKPRRLADGRREWVPLAGIVLSRDHDPSSLTCVSLATGMKCLPREKVPLAKGSILHDWHAEVLCLRGFNRWLVDECAELAARGKSGGDSEWLAWNHDTGEGRPPFSLHENVRLYMYCTQAPCGDASMELTISAQQDSTPWSSAPAPSSSSDTSMLGRGHFDQLGIVRRKPSRPDAPVCWSKSCSDKLTLKQCLGLLCGLTGLLVQPCWLEVLVLPEGEVVPEAVGRCFGGEGRMKNLDGWGGGEGGFKFRPFVVETTRREFEFEKEEAAVPSNLSALWMPRRKEVLINGVLQGRKQMDPKGASCVSRRRLWEGVLEVAGGLDLESLKGELERERYGDVKDSWILEERRRAKRFVKERALRGWKRNDGDEDWGLETGP
ncbi:hypothetical protein M409DRAFT_63606 [Zasmidium cellare ATCC 36951]|uniref:A to I editase domain-containing protein n=1 Tax=Zasmidium cellare ATCC 36951 TaxID=1080233 RepID=A0A6A6CYK4_ZASCE|nr:uncharacterized protein M409DRAFT_63606 [Zasmidium cellare ATCC 36951]KAF2171248.1 hypothetical protein M409DRAFT_63606 [Zasmidium cellare ATCC 36951]